MQGLSRSYDAIQLKVTAINHLKREINWLLQKK